MNVCGFKMPNPVGAGLPNPAAYDTTVAGVVTDTVTGLVWERAVSPSTYTQATAAAYCTNNRVNSKTDWRLPTVLELTSIVDVTAENGTVAINQTVFPSTPGADYITSTLVAGASTAWRMNFNNGNTVQGNVTTPTKVRCVRSGGTPAPRCAMSRVRFTLQTSAGVTTVSDATTGLTWRQDVGTRREWAMAESYCAGLPGGFRQPSVNEFLTLVDFGIASQPPIDLMAFPLTPPDSFWTSSPLSGVPTAAWLMDFSTGSSTWNGSGAQYYVRCVK